MLPEAVPLGYHHNVPEVLGAIAPSTSGTLWWYPSGTASGSVSHYAPAFVSSRGKEFPYDDVVTITIGFQFTSSPTAGTVA